MPVEDGNFHLPQGESMMDAFVVPTQKHFTVGRTIEEVYQSPWGEVALATEDFFTAGVAYLANRGHDAYMQEVGTTTWWAVNQKQAIAALARSPLEAAIQLGASADDVRKVGHQPGEPYVLFAENRQGIVTVEFAFTLMPPEFIVKAQNRQVEALATMAWISSQVRDLANGRIRIDPEHVLARAHATEAHFLLHAREKHPDIELASEYIWTLDKYPEGLYSLPRDVRYKGLLDSGPFTD